MESVLEILIIKEEQKRQEEDKAKFIKRCLAVNICHVCGSDLKGYYEFPNHITECSKDKTHFAMYEYENNNEW